MRFDALTPFRFFSAIVVIIYHFGEDLAIWDFCASIAYQMLSFFFVLSGFVLTIAYFSRHTPYKAFMQARIARIAPCYLIALSLTLIAQLTDGRHFGSEHILILLALVSVHLLLIQAWTPLALSLNFPSWSLSVEMALYAVFPALQKWIRKAKPSPKKLFMYALGFWLFTQVILSIALHFISNEKTFAGGLVNLFPPSHLCSFILGIAAAYWLLHEDKATLKKLQKKTAYSAAILLPLILLLIIQLPWLEQLLNIRIAMRSSATAPLFTLLIVAIALDSSKLTQALSIKPLLIAGEISYGMYIFQYPIHKLWEDLIGQHLSLPYALDFTAYLLVLISFSLLIYFKVELPSQIKFRQWIKKRQST